MLLHVDMLFHNLILCELPLFFLLCSLLQNLFVTELGSFSPVLDLLVLILLDERACLLALFITLLHLTELQDLITSILLLGKFDFHLDLGMMLLSLLILEGDLISS